MFPHIERWLGDNVNNRIEIARHAEEYFARAIIVTDEMNNKGIRINIHIHEIVAYDSGPSIYDAIENLDIVFEAKYK